MKKIKGTIVEAGMWSIIGTLLVKGTYFLTIPLYSRLLTTNDYGNVSIFMTYANVLSIVLSFYIAASVSTGIIKFQKSKNDFLASALTFSIIIFLFFVLVFQFFHNQFETIFQLNYGMLMCLLLYSFGQHVINFNSSKLIMDYAYKKNAAISFGVLAIDTVLSTILIILLSGQGVLARILGATVPSTCAGIAIIIYILSKGKDYFNRNYWKYALTISGPLIFHALAHLVLGQSDRVMIKYYIGASEAGIYALIHNISVMMNAAQEALNNVWIPWFFRKLKEQSFGEIKEMANAYIGLFTLGTIALSSIYVEIIKILAPAEYWDGIVCVIPLIFSTYICFLYTLFVNLEIYHEYSKGIAVGTCGAAIINIILNFWLLPILGYKIASCTTAASYLALLVFHIGICRKKVKIKMFDYKTIMLNTVVVLFFELAMLVLKNLFTVRICILFLCGGIILVKNKDILLKLFNNIK